MFSFRTRTCHVAVVLFSAAVYAHASAQSPADTPTPVETPPEPAIESARAGMFLPLTLGPRTDSQRGFAIVRGGYDSARSTGLVEGVADVTLIGPLAARLGVSYREANESALRPSVGLRLQPLNQADHGIDAAVGIFYKPEGFTEAEGEIEAVLSFGRTFDRVGLFGNVVYGQDGEGIERDGELRLAGQYEWTPRLQAGLDARVRFDMGEEGREAEAKRATNGEASFDVVVGPVASYAFDRFAVLAQVAASVVARERDSTLAGVLFLAGLAGSL
jgi:hypothetical protein